MTVLSRLEAFAAVSVLALGLASCSDDSTPADNGNADTTPPSIVSVTPVDALHIEVSFGEEVTRASAEDPRHYAIVEADAPVPGIAPAQAASPGDTLHVATASLQSDNKTVSLSTQGPMGPVDYRLSVLGVSDSHGNAIALAVDNTFAGSTAPDVTAPEVVSCSPAANATGVGVGVSVSMQFSEPVPWGNFTSSVTWTSDGGSVGFGVQNDGLQFSLTPSSALANGTRYTVTLTGIQDFSANTMASTSWSFTTTNITDTTPPTLVSTVPANLATNVSVNTNLSLTFSEAIDQSLFQVQLSPEPGDGVETWSNGGKTLTFDPTLPLLDDQQYTLSILPDGVRDLAGNGIEDVEVVNFTTGGTIASGGFSGTLTGDPNSNYASDPTGATVAAADAPPFGQDNFGIAGTDIAAANNTYSIAHLPDDVYYPVAVKDTNGDGNIDPSSGDALGGYGMDFGAGDASPDSVTIAGGTSVTGIDFPMYDPSAVGGTVQYVGSHAGNSYRLFIGMFDTSGFDPSDSPVYGTEAFWPSYRDWFISGLEGGLVDDDYYVGAFLDVNGNGSYDSATDPAGFYGGASPTVVHVAHGSDALGLVIVLEDPPVGKASHSAVWSLSKRSRAFQWICQVVRRSQPPAAR